MATRIGVDIGGTFTDLVYYDEQTGRTLEGKVSTVPSAPDQGVIDAVRQIPQAVVRDAELFLHGTTVGLNALLERRGARVGLIATEGFRDVLEIRRGDRAEMYNLFWRQPEPLVPRERRLGVAERIMPTGRVHRELDTASVLAAYRLLAAEGVDAIAVCLMHAYANPAHELSVEKILRQAGYEGGISLSHKVSGEYREYERTSTVVIDAFVRARMSNYLRRLEARLRELGFSGSCLITRSGGGSMSFAEAEERPFETIMSGPVAGAQGAGELARSLGLKGLITADVGGTSFDTAIVVDGWPQVLYEGVIDGMPLQTPWIDVRSIGAGGGSVAYIDQGGLMRVGPRSAGAVPGPASYGRGGTEPTVTDAAAYLGMLGPGELASGIRLDIGKAEAALAGVGSRIGLSAAESAKGILRIAASNMANAMREVSVEQGLDPREMALLPFGGAGPLMATLLADELQMTRIVLPPLAGNFSAWGLLGADMVRSAARTRVMGLDPASLREVNGLLVELFAELAGRGESFRRATVKLASLDIRYRGQEHWLSVDVPLAGSVVDQSAAEIHAAFEREYEKNFGSTMDEAVEIVSVRATERMPLPRRRTQFQPPAAGAGGPASVFEAYSFSRQANAQFRLVRREDIAGALAGPAIVLENTTTFYVDAGWQVSLGGQGELNVAKETR